MSKTSIILSALMSVAFILLMAPGVLALNRGKILRNTAIWLAVIAGLGLIYTNFGPDSKNPIIPASPAITQSGNNPQLGHRAIVVPPPANP